MSRFKALAKMLGTKLDDASKVLEKIDNPELATSLKGEAREDYLKALDEVYGPQSKRSKDMGFGDENYYHGTAENFEEFKNINEGLSGRLSKNTHFLTPQSELANKFADHAAIKTNKSDFIKNLEENLRDESVKLLDEYIAKTGSAMRALKDPEYLLKQKKLDRLKDDIMTTNSTVMPLKVRTTPKIIKGKGQELPISLINEHTKDNQSVLFKNFKDNPSLSDKTKSDILAIKDPSQIRSKYAAFDPRFKDSALLMAGGATIPTTDINPLESFKGIQENILEPVMSKYNKLKSYVTDPLSKQLDLTKDKSASKDLKTALDMGLDPINLIPGAPGIGAGLLQMLGEKDEEE